MTHPGAFGSDRFGRAAESGARFFGTPQYIVGQTLIVIVWIALNSIAIVNGWDPYPFILLNLAFSTQAAYAAPLILLAQTRQADRDHLSAQKDERHREAAAQRADDRVEAIKTETDVLRSLLQENTELTKQDTQLTQEVERLTRAIHTLLADAPRAEEGSSTG
jgi:uncharacterized membrane protein